MKTGFDNKLCRNCAYKKNGVCEVDNKRIINKASCPEHYTYELCRQISLNFYRRRVGLPPIKEDW